MTDDVARPRAFADWLSRQPGRLARPWLLLGKGPSFDRLPEFELSGFETLALNHVVRERPVTVAHAIDLEVVEQCGDAIERHAGALVMPWRPHTRNGRLASVVTGYPARVSDEPLDVLARQHPVLRRLCAQGRLLWYNLSTDPNPRADGPVVPVRCFSAEAALHLLATSGVRVVRSLGIDGGRQYAAAFDDLTGQTLLANGRRNFDGQFEAIAQTMHRTGVSYAPLDVEHPIRVFVAATDIQRLAVRVLAYSIRRRASMDVEVSSIGDAGPTIPLPRDPARRPRTPFSFQRFLIPALAGYRGRAIYLDSDMLVFRDIARLWTLPMDGADVLAARAGVEADRRPQFSVMLLDCDRLRWDIADIVTRLDDGRLDYQALMYEMAVADNVRAGIPASWNALETFDPDETALLHYTDMPTQPWLSTANPLGYLWVRALFDAVDEGAISRAEVAAEVEAGHVRPSLLFQLDNRLEDSLVLPAGSREADRTFTPSWTAISRSAPAWRRYARTLRGLARHAARASGLAWAGRRLRIRLVR